ncbi:piggyBac transposable element-derived protein 4-like, partial [Vespula maculifrons]
FENENEENDQDSKVAIDGAVREEIQEDSRFERPLHHYFQISIKSNEYNNIFETKSQLKLLQKPAMNLIVNEQLFPTKVKCRFIQHMPDKPDKFGIKF